MAEQEKPSVTDLVTADKIDTNALSLDRSKGFVY